MSSRQDVTFVDDHPFTDAAIRRRLYAPLTPARRRLLHLIELTEPFSTGERIMAIAHAADVLESTHAHVMQSLAWLTAKQMLMSWMITTAPDGCAYAVILPPGSDALDLAASAERFLKTVRLARRKAS